MENTVATIRSNPLSIFMLVISLTCDFGYVDELIVASLTRLTQRDLEDYWWLSFSVANFGWVYGGIKNDDIL